MLAGKIDIGSMGDYPLLINGSRAGTGDDGDSMVAVTGYNPHGALNGVVVAGGLRRPRPSSDLEGGDISASVGSAGHGTLVQALEAAGIDPNDDVTVENQDPPVGASSLAGRLGRRGRPVRGLAGPAGLPRRRPAGLRRRPARPADPARHGRAQRVRRRAARRSSTAFLEAQIDATDYLHENPVEAAEIVAEATGLPVEVVYLYNGRNGVSTFDTTLKPEQVAALEHDVPFLKSIGVLEDPLDLDAFVDDSLHRDAYGDGVRRRRRLARRTPRRSPAPTRCASSEVTDPALAGEVWVQGEDDTRPVADPDLPAAQRARRSRPRAARCARRTSPTR